MHRMNEFRNHFGFNRQPYGAAIDLGRLGGRIKYIKIQVLWLGEGDWKMNGKFGKLPDKYKMCFSNCIFQNIKLFLICSTSFTLPVPCIFHHITLPKNEKKYREFIISVLIQEIYDSHSPIIYSNPVSYLYSFKLIFILHLKRPYISEGKLGNIADYCSNFSLSRKKHFLIKKMMWI